MPIKHYLTGTKIDYSTMVFDLSKLAHSTTDKDEYLKATDTYRLLITDKSASVQQQMNASWYKGVEYDSTSWFRLLGPKFIT